MSTEAHAFKAGATAAVRGEPFEANPYCHELQPLEFDAWAEAWDIVMETAE